MVPLTGTISARRSDITFNLSGPQITLAPPLFLPLPGAPNTAKTAHGPSCQAEPLCGIHPTTFDYFFPISKSKCSKGTEPAPQTLELSKLGFCIFCADYPVIPEPRYFIKISILK